VPAVRALAWAVIEEKEVEGERVLLREAVGAEGADDSSISLSLSLSLFLSLALGRALWSTASTVPDSRRARALAKVWCALACRARVHTCDLAISCEMTAAVKREYMLLSREYMRPRPPPSSLNPRHASTHSSHQKKRRAVSIFSFTLVMNKHLNTATSNKQHREAARREQGWTTRSHSRP